MTIPTRIPGITYAKAPRAQASAAALALPPRIIVVHDTGNNSSNRFDEASYAANRTDPKKDWTSAHGYVDGGGVLGSLPLNLQAWAAYSYANGHGWHIELCRTAAGTSAATRLNAAGLVRQLADLAGLPKVKLTPAEVAAGRKGICGHRDITIGLGVGNHDDPGPGFPWVQFMQQVNGSGGAPAAPTPPEEDDMKWMLVRGFAPDTSQVWLVNGMTRRKISSSWLAGPNGEPGKGPVSNVQIFSEAFLGNLWVGTAGTWEGQVFVSGGDPDVWGVDVTGSTLDLDSAELQHIGETIAAEVREQLVDDVADELHDRLQA